MENLGRGVVAIKQPDGKIFVSWRLLGTDDPNLGFNVYRSAGSKVVRLNAAPVTGPTHFVDAGVDAGVPTSYFVRAVAGGREGEPSRPFTLAVNSPAQPYLSLPLQTPAGYTPNDASVGDLDGDGEYEIILHQVGRSKDNSQAGETDPPILQAYKLDGTMLWEINLGKNIREGAHYTQFMVFDLDGDGRAEVACKTADGTRDGKGKVIGDPNANHVNEGGYILRGPEFLTVFDGKTGAALATTKYIPGRHPDTDNPTGDQMKAIWGDGYGNRGDRFLAGIAYLDGVHPSLVMARGYYTRTFLVAWDFRGGKLSHRWTFDSEAPGVPEGFSGQGNHSLIVADVDGDGKDEILYGKMAVSSDGKGLYTTRIGHGDAAHLTDLDPDRPGLEMFGIQEPFGDAGAHMYDARTGEILWKKASVTRQTGGQKVEGPGRGVAADIDPRHRGYESWVAGAGLGGQLWNAKGEKIGDTTPSVNFRIFWDGDTLSELLDGNTIFKWDYLNGRQVPMLEGKNFGVVSNNGTKATPTLSADILGDWREEVIWRSEDNKELRIFSTTIPTEHRFYTLMHDPVYRLSIAWQNVAYNQPPHTGFLIGADMTTLPRPNIVLVQPQQAPQQAARPATLRQPAARPAKRPTAKRPAATRPAAARSTTRPAAH
ncbi:MAG: rhamnogalacturonan lyase [Armatimonadetes bacterium]|nr:rhamnogalacturonan lyase [Armatimonadota bacterium]